MTDHLLTPDEIRTKKADIKKLDTEKMKIRALLKDLEFPCAVIRKLDELRTQLNQSTELLKKLDEKSKEYQDEVNSRISLLTLIEKAQQKLPKGIDEKQTLIRFMDLRTQFYDLEEQMVTIRKEIIADAKRKRI